MEMRLNDGREICVHAEAGDNRCRGEEASLVERCCNGHRTYSVSMNDE